MALGRSLLNRLLLCLGLVLAVVVLNFVLVHAAPGDPVSTIAGVSGGMSPELMAQLIHSADERIPVDDLELGLQWVRHAARTLLA